ncbi:unnamed protein product [Paramecium sonneborni]|uniref:Uncharacterized protein n=1 Tax=Paramecium sonneborni TaxID=65129 RepID=A0A8S1RMZ8_9CILI|nr:unnamed protein product [Paramecium sonneborni]
MNKIFIRCLQHLVNQELKIQIASKHLNIFEEELRLIKNDNLIKYLLIICIGYVKQKVEDINHETIKLLANSFKEKSIHQGLKILRIKVPFLEKHV